VIVFDANLLIYAYDENSSHHVQTRGWVEKIFSGAEPVGLPWQAIYAFLRIMTNRKLPGTRLTLDAAGQIVDRWLEQPAVRILGPGDQHWALLRQMMIDGQASGVMVSDAQIAALAIEYGGVLHTADRDFARFPGLRWKNPLQS
jgi:toxin-antitoxin system PIN domain toxin